MVTELQPFSISPRPTETELVAKYFRALSDPTRLAILELITSGERAVGEIATALGQPQPKVSNHLACLRWCGFVTTRREHRTIYYRLADERLEQLLALGRALLAENEEHVAMCRRIDRGGG